MGANPRLSKTIRETSRIANQPFTMSLRVIIAPTLQSHVNLRDRRSLDNASFTMRPERSSWAAVTLGLAI